MLFIFFPISKYHEVTLHHHNIITEKLIALILFQRNVKMKIIILLKVIIIIILSNTVFNTVFCSLQIHILINIFFPKQTGFIFIWHLFQKEVFISNSFQKVNRQLFNYFFICWSRFHQSHAGCVSKSKF